jgi:hypothetical protein
VIRVAAKAKDLLRLEPIRWTSPNGKPQTAVCIPCTGRDFRLEVKHTLDWSNTMRVAQEGDKIPPRWVGWLIEVGL